MLTRGRTRDCGGERRRCIVRAVSPLTGTVGGVREAQCSRGGNRGEGDAAAALVARAESADPPGTLGGCAGPRGAVGGVGGHSAEAGGLGGGSGGTVWLCAVSR